MQTLCIAYILLHSNKYTYKHKPVLSSIRLDTQQSQLREEEKVMVKFIEGNNNYDIDNIVDIGIIIDHPDKTLGRELKEIALEVATEVIIEEADTEVNEDDKQVKEI